MLGRPVGILLGSLGIGLGVAATSPAFADKVLPAVQPVAVYLDRVGEELGLFTGAERTCAPSESASSSAAIARWRVVCDAYENTPEGNVDGPFRRAVGL
jgi:hypothetical protein